jgi:hypothetical protein
MSGRDLDESGINVSGGTYRMTTIPVVGSEANLPIDIAGLHYQGVSRFPNPDGGVKIRYGIPALAVADVYLYNAGLSDIPDDLWSSDVEARFEESCDLVRAAETQGMLEDLVDLASGYLHIPAAAAEPLCLWASFAFTPNTGQPLPTTDHPGTTPVVTDVGRKHSHLALRTDHGYINKIRYTYPAEDAEKGFAAFRDFVYEWTKFVQGLPRTPKVVAGQTESRDGRPRMSAIRGENFLVITQAKAHELIREALVEPDQHMNWFVAGVGRYGDWRLPGPEAINFRAMTQAAVFTTAMIGSNCATDAALVYQAHCLAVDPVSGQQVPDTSPDRRESVRLVHVTRDGSCNFYTSEVCWRDSKSAEIGDWVQTQAPESLTEHLIVRLKNGMLVSTHVDLDYLVTAIRRGMSIADSVDGADGSLLRDGIDAAYRISPEEGHREWMECRDNLYRIIIRQAFATEDNPEPDDETMRFVMQLPETLSYNEIIQAVQSYLRSRSHGRRPVLRQPDEQT